MTKEGDLYSFQYSQNKGQLTQVTKNGEVKQEYSYDSLYNRLKGSNGNNVYNENKDLLLEDHLWKYTYDVRGNLLSKQRKSDHEEKHNYTYDHKGRLIGFHKKDGGADAVIAATYPYGPLGDRIGKDVTYRDQPSKNYTRWYVYDEGQLLQELDENLQVIKQYIINGQPGGLAGFIYKKEEYYFIKDAKNSIDHILDKNGEVVNSYHYDPFGETTTLQNTIHNDIGYCSKLYDEESGLYYSKARHYDPLTGRFIQPDPIFHERPVGTMLVNAYVYALANPIRYSDPNGLDVWDDLLVVIIAVVAIVVVAALTALTGGTFLAALGAGFLWAGIGGGSTRAGSTHLWVV